MSKLFIILVVAVSICAQVSHAERDAAPVDFNDFDGGMVGARALGMGNALVAVRNVAEAPYWNPAGLNLLKNNMFSVSLDMFRTSRIKTDELFRVESLRGRKLTYLSVTGHNGALYFRPLANKYVETVLDASDPLNNVETKEIKINAFGLSLANRSMYTDSATSVGMNIAFLTGSLATSRIAQGEAPQVNLSDGNGFTIDWGTMIQLNENFLLGLTVQNVPGYIYWEDYRKTQLPVLLRMGFSLELPNLLTFSTEYERRYYRNTGEKPKFIHLGVEQHLGYFIRARGGIYGDDLGDPDTVNHTAGIGLQKRGYIIDFAFRKYLQTDSKTLKREKVYQYVMSIIMPFSQRKYRTFNR